MVGGLWFGYLVQCCNGTVDGITRFTNGHCAVSLQQKSVAGRRIVFSTRLIAEHWFGRAPLWVTIAVTLIGFRWALGMIQSELPQPALLPWLAASIAIFVWQIVGAWRAIDRHARSHGSIMSLWLGYAAIVLVFALTLMQSLDAVARRGLVGSSYEPFVLTTDDSGRTVVIEGDINWHHYTALKAALAEPNSINWVRLHSEGGLVFAARAIASIVMEHSLSTYSDLACYSACTLVFVAGKERLLSSQARLGFHQYSVESPVDLVAVDPLRAQQTDQDYLLGRGIATEFVDDVFQSGPDTMWFPDRDVLVRAKVITQ